MDSMWLVLTALAFGVFLGAAFMIVLHMAERRGSSAARVVAPTIPDGIDQVLEVLESAGVVLDPSNNVLKASPGALAMGLVRQQALVHPELVELVASVRRTGAAVAEEVTVSRGPFGESTLRLRVRVARLGTRFILLLAEDRTEAHRLDEVRRDFVANISHELKTPIASVSLLAEALDHAADEPEQVRRFAGRLTVEASRLAHITSEVIALSRLQARDALLPDVLVPVDEVVAAAVDQNRVVAAGKHVEVAVRAASGAYVYGDRALMVVAVHNLVSNAIAYSNDGGRVGVGVKVDGDTVEIAVTDQGIGIESEDLERVFERFYRVDQARSRNTGGSGLGLSIVKHTVQNHGGDVRVWSQPGRGSTFMIRLPLAEPPTSTDAAPPAPAAQQPIAVPDRGDST
jgi:two-component system, OmpR family, sensor histidine kinase SenX3